ncbi:MAG TPA: hypothetical protein VG496_12970, partial [Myxococcales bacterium]|nr:hypothetical protein [Myxococcales bacterium]
AAKLLGRLRVPLYVASIEGAYDHWPRWDARPRLRKMRVRLAFQLALPALDDRSRSRRSPRSWWQSVYVSGGSLDVEATRASIHSALSHAAAGERQAIDLSRVKRLAALPRLICFCPECGLPRTAIHNRQLICRACGAAWIPDRDGRLRRIGHGETLAAVFMRMAERLERRASEAFALEEPIAVRGVHPSSAVGTGAFVAGTARVSSGGLDVVTAGERWRIPLHLAANADIEGGRIVALRAPGGEPLHLRLENGALRLVLAARALLGLPISGLAP